MQEKRQKHSTSYYMGMSKSQWLIILTLSLVVFSIVCIGILIVSSSVLDFSKPNTYAYFQPTSTPRPANTFSPTRIPTKVPTRVPTEAPTTTPNPTSTPTLFTNDAQNYLLQQADVPNGLSIFPGSSGAYTPDYNDGALSSYIITFIRDDIDFSIETEVWSINNFLVVYSDETNAKKAYAIASNKTKKTDTSSLSKAGSIDIPSTDEASLLTGLSLQDGVIVTEAWAIFRKANVMGKIRVTGGLESSDVIENALNSRISEAAYFAGILALKIK